MRSILLSVLLLGNLVSCAAPASGTLLADPAVAAAPAAPAAAAAEGPAPAVPTPRTALLALSKRDHTLSIVDPATLQIVARVPVGEDPHEVIASADGRLAYVSNYGGGAFNTLAVIDLVHQRALPAIDLGALRGPHGLVARGGKIWFTAEAAKAIGSYDPASGKIDWALGTGQDRTHMLFVWDDLKRIVTTNVSSGTVTIIDKHVGPRGGPPGGPGGPPPGGPGGRGPMGPPGGDWDETVVPVGHGPEGFDVTPDGKEIWVANAHDGTISIVDAATRAVTQTVSADVVSANRLKITPDGKRALVSALRAPDLSIFDVATRQRVKRLPVGRGSSGILVQPDGARAYVACTPDGHVAVVDLKTLEVAGRVDVGPEPDGLAWAVRP